MFSFFSCWSNEYIHLHQQSLNDSQYYFHVFKLHFDMNDSWKAKKSITPNNDNGTIVPAIRINAFVQKKAPHNLWKWSRIAQPAPSPSSSYCRPVCQTTRMIISSSNGILWNRSVAIHNFPSMSHRVSLIKCWQVLEHKEVDMALHNTCSGQRWYYSSALCVRVLQETVDTYVSHAGETLAYILDNHALV